MNDFVVPRLTFIISNKKLAQDSVPSSLIWKLHNFSPTLVCHLVPCHASGLLPNPQLCMTSQGSLRLLILIMASLRGLSLRKKQKKAFLTVFSIAGFLHYKRMPVNILWFIFTNTFEIIAEGRRER